MQKQQQQHASADERTQIATYSAVDDEPNANRAGGDEGGADGTETADEPGVRSRGSS